MNSIQYKSFKEFYPFYLSQHQNPTCRNLHFVGSLLVILIIVGSILTQKWTALLLAPIAGYSFAWIGHFFFEKNQPATFKYPFYSLMGDWVMLGERIWGKIL